MRLLHFDQLGTLVCTNFAGETIPPYAILSHRWGDDELSYEDVVSRRYQSKVDGHPKIAFCAKQMVADGLSHFWIDSCCIDKNKRLERSNAINSMFVWYRDAAKCYVYLSDVSTPNGGDAKHRSRWDRSFRESDWHNRGWTLQELIAPRSVDFFSVQGQRLGTRADLAQILCEITGLPLDLMHSGSLDKFSMAERIKWGKSRETKEPEDAAYCLLGILEVYMPLSYGEGKNKAMGRLRERIQDPGKLSTVPFSRYDGFVGREGELRKLQEMLSDGTPGRVIGILGEGGTGKTQLTLELAYRMTNDDATLAVFWIDAGDVDSFQLGCISIAQILDLTGWADEGADVGQLVKASLEAESEKRWLLVLDNVESVALGSRQLIDYLPRSASGTVIFTTTEREAVDKLAAEPVIELRQMTADAAQDMIKAYLPEVNVDEQQDEVSQLLSDLSHLPLAIAQATAYMEKVPGATIHGYRQQLHAQQNQRDWMRHEGSEYEDDDRDPVATTMMITLELLTRKRPLAVDYLLIAACVDRKDILLDLLGPKSSERAQAVEDLRDFRLITRRPADDSFDVHRLVHLALRRWLREGDTTEQWIQYTMARLVDLFPSPRSENRGRWRRLLPHTSYILGWDEEDLYQEDGAGVRTRSGTQVRHLPRQPETRFAIAKASVNDKNSGRGGQSRISAQEHPCFSPEQGTGSQEKVRFVLLGRCVSALFNDGRSAEAAKLGVQVMALSKRVLGEAHADTLTSMNNIGVIYMSQGRWTDAEELEVEVVEKSKELLGEEHEDTLTSINNLVLIYRNQGRQEDAEKLGIQIMEKTKRVLGEDHLSTLTSMRHLAFIYKDQGRWAEAEKLGTQAMESSQRMFGEEHPETLVCIHNLAFIWRSAGRDVEALALMTKCERLYRLTLGDQHPSTLRATDTLRRWSLEQQ